MLRFEREVVRSLVTSPDAHVRAEVEHYVDGALRAMPEYLRGGLVAESVTLGAWAGIRGARKPTEPEALARLLGAWEESPLGVLCMYVRLFRSLVLFAECELAPAPAS
ncbi:MAG TPA: hypothetical protein VF152_14125 [Acidimicrobiia bacterium]